jgi:hypothetical protein
MDKGEALKLALAALERYQIKRQDFDTFAEAIAAIKEALAQPSQEPVGAVAMDGRTILFYDNEFQRVEPFSEVYLTPPETAQPEPVAWMVDDNLCMRADWTDHLNYKGHSVDLGRAIPNSWVPILYTTPPQRPWVGLTEDEWSDLYEAHHDKYNHPKQGGLDGLDYERAIEAKLKDKNK